MIVDRRAAVTPPRYSSPEFRKAMGDLLGKANRDDLLRVLIWTAECRIASNVAADWRAHLDLLNRELTEAKRRTVYRFGSNTIAISSACRKAAEAVREALSPEILEAKEALGECEQVLDELSRYLGQHLGARARTEARTGPTLEGITPLRDQLAEARNRLEQILAADKERLHALALANGYATNSSKHGAGADLSTIDRMTPEQFTRHVVEMLHRDGCHLEEKALQDHRSPSLIVASSDLGTLAIRPHHMGVHTYTTSAPNVTAPMLRRDVQAAAAHDCNHVLIVTNSSLSRPARRYAAQQRMRLIDRDNLRNWSEWRQPLAQLADFAEAE
ncbi:restriction endonuclease [Streptomyces sp. NPDC056527]|uniref:restriction endonuclease n=1 Tax=Streptomyces sp. NPDC056527 TaxID=3345853 RepID=UPI0036C6763D